jgi:hypothetical protein
MTGVFSMGGPAKCQFSRINVMLLFDTLLFPVQIGNF